MPSETAQCVRKIPELSIRTIASPKCYLCGTEGEPLYRGLRDRFFGAPGTWNLKECPNAHCSLVWLDPKPLEEDIGKAYETYYTHVDESTNQVAIGRKRSLTQAVKVGYLALKYGYGKDVSLIYKTLGLAAYLIPFRRALVDFSRMYLPAVPGGRLLEIGCGRGDMLLTMRDLGWQVEGVDFDSRAVATCRRKGLTVHVGTLERMEYPNNYFDAITMSHLIEHVNDPLRLLRECHRILKAGGRLSLVTPNISSLGHRLFTSAWFHLDPPRHLHLFTRESLGDLICKAGFGRGKISTTIRDANSAFIASRAILRSGAYNWGEVASRGNRVWGRSMQALEWMLLKINRNSGEELAAVVEK